MRRYPAAYLITYGAPRGGSVPAGRCEAEREFPVVLLGRAAWVHRRGAGKKEVDKKAAGLA